jgi:hypothetical protein
MPGMIAAMPIRCLHPLLSLELVVAPCLVLLAASCAQPQDRPSRPVPLVMESRANLLLALQRCSDEHGYDPANTQLGEHELAPGELGWRECAYGALRVHALSNPELKGQYEKLIAEDKRMTEAIVAGTMTRSERQSRIDVLVAEIRTAENAQARNTATDLRNVQINRLRETIDGLQDFVR